MELFKKLCSIHSPSMAERPLKRFIRKWVNENVPTAIVSHDMRGNMYIVKGKSDTYPCVVAHLDQVQDRYPHDIQIEESANIIFSYSPTLRRQCGLGGDDKCGIWIALKMLQKHEAIKIAFFVGEEVGCVGSSDAVMEFFVDVRFVIEPDRRGNHDLITTIGYTSLCSDEFVSAIRPQDFGYMPNSGAMTDVETLRERGLKISCINLSCGYYNPHTEDEFVDKGDMINALNFVNSIIENCTDVYRIPDDELYMGRLGGWYEDEFDCATSDVQDLLRSNPELNADDMYNELGMLYPTLQPSDFECIVKYFKELDDKDWWQDE